MLTNLLAILIFGSLVLLGVILIANPLQVNKRANIWFGVFVFFWASFWLHEIISLISVGRIELESVFLLKFIQFLTPLFFYISIEFYVNPEYKIMSKFWIYLLIPLIYLALLILDFTIDIKMAITVFLLAYSLVCVLLSLWLLRKHNNQIQKFASNTSEIDLLWLEYIVWLLFVLLVGIAVFNLLFFNLPLNAFMNGFVYLIVLFTAYHSLKQKEIFPADFEERAQVLSVVQESETDEIQVKIMSDEKLVELKSQLNDLITSEEPYLDSELNLGKLANKLNITSHQLSYVINNGFNQNFFSFVNTYRVEKAKKLLADNILDNYSIIGIAFESGFNSKTAFNTTFKKFTGQTPSEYKKASSGL